MQFSTITAIEQIDVQWMSIGHRKMVNMSSNAHPVRSIHWAHFIVLVKMDTITKRLFANIEIL